MTEQGYGKRTPFFDFPVKHRATGGVIANSLNADTGDVAAVRMVGREDEEMMLITEEGTILRTEVSSVNRYRRASRGRHRHEAGAAAIGSCRSRSSSTIGRPRASRRRATRGRAAPERPSARGCAAGRVRGRDRHLRRSDVYADEFSIYAGNANRALAQDICRYLKTPDGRRRGLPVREREHLRARAWRTSESRTSSWCSPPAGRSTSRSWSC